MLVKINEAIKQQVPGTFLFACFLLMESLNLLFKALYDLSVIT